MKKLYLLLALCLLLTGCSQAPVQPSAPEAVCAHTDEGNDGFCDSCSAYVVELFDFYAVNDLHGKVADADSHPGVDELTTYLKNARLTDDHSLLLSVGDMWQGTSESNMTNGLLMTDWMNQVGFAAMAMGNHEYDWGEDPVLENHQLAEFPFLAINIYDRETDQQVEYCKSSILVDQGSLQIGIIGAIGDCYSSIAVDQVKDIYFKTDHELTALVKDEAQKLRDEGADFIVYLLHDGYGGSKSDSVTPILNKHIDDYYDPSLSHGYVDLVFEGHTHQKYILKDEMGVLHLQNGGDNKGISHVEIAINTANGSSEVLQAELIATGKYANMDDDPIVEELLGKYEDVISPANRILGTNARQRPGDEMRQLVADCYYETGVAYWGDEYDIVLGGGFVSVRKPGYLAAGDVTYSMLYSLFPFDNQLVLCSIKGRDLQDRFFESDNSNYFIGYGDYGEQVRKNIDPDKTYYVVVDSYSSPYAPNKLTEIDRYTDGIYARDLLADYIEDGNLS